MTVFITDFIQFQLTRNTKRDLRMVRFLSISTGFNSRAVQSAT